MILGRRITESDEESKTSNKQSTEQESSGAPSPPPGTAASPPQSSALASLNLLSILADQLRKTEGFDRTGTQRNFNSNQTFPRGSSGGATGEYSIDSIVATTSGGISPSCEPSLEVSSKKRKRNDPNKSKSFTLKLGKYPSADNKQAQATRQLFTADGTPIRKNGIVSKRGPLRVSRNFKAHY